jgi:hypothetical protein
MGMKLSRDINAIAQTIRYMQNEMNDLRVDSWTTWGIKQDLYQLKWLIDEALESAAHYTPEDQWIKEQQQQRIIQKLKKTSK